MIEEGDLIQGYTFVEELGNGSFGEVWKVRKDNMDFAVKIVKKKDKTGEQEVMFADNMKLTSPFLVHYCGSFKKNEQSPIVFIVMELCPEGDLSKLVKKLDKKRGIILSTPRFMKIAIQLLLGMYELHHQNILHRDVKLENIFVDSNDNVKLGDFGCGHFLDHTLDQAKTFVGTFPYMSPEICAQTPYGFEADVWALGVVFYILCTLERPFPADNFFALSAMVMKGEYEPIPENLYPDEICSMIYSMLTTDRSNRPSVLDLLGLPVVRKFANQLDIRRYFPSELRGNDDGLAPSPPFLLSLSPSVSASSLDSDHPLMAHPSSSASSFAALSSFPTNSPADEEDDSFAHSSSSSSSSSSFSNSSVVSTATTPSDANPNTAGANVGGKAKAQTQGRAQTHAKAKTKAQVHGHGRARSNETTINPLFGEKPTHAVFAYPSMHDHYEGESVLVPVSASATTTDTAGSVHAHPNAGEKKRVPHGQGNWTSAEGDTYVGKWVYGKITGKGVYTWADGEKYEGDWEGDERDGYGTDHLADGGVYEGEFSGDVIHGTGTYTYPGKGRYKGQFVRGEREGKGKYTFADKRSYEGDWKGGRSHGQGKFTWPDGRTFEGGFVNNMKQGRGVEKDRKGKVLRQGEWKDDEFVLRKQ